MSSILGISARASLLMVPCAPRWQPAFLLMRVAPQRLSSRVVSVSTWQHSVLRTLPLSCVAWSLLAAVANLAATTKTCNPRVS